MIFILNNGNNKIHDMCSLKKKKKNTRNSHHKVKCPGSTVRH